MPTFTSDSFSKKNWRRLTNAQTRQTHPGRVPDAGRHLVRAPHVTGDICDTGAPIFGEQPLIIVAFAASALVFLVLGFVISRQHIRRAELDQDAGCVQTGLVLGCALSEVPSIFGLLLAFIWEYQYFYFWIVLSIIGILIHFPRRGDLDAATYKSQ
jgi:hypothetical protein